MPIIGHIKQDHRTGRNYYKGFTGDNINIMFAAAAFNFKRMMNKWKSSFWLFIENLFQLCFFKSKLFNHQLLGDRLSF